MPVTRYFAILDPRTKRVHAMADSAAIGRVVSNMLSQYTVGSADYLVREVKKSEFEAYKRATGTVRA